MMPTATCQYCGWNGPADQCGPLKNAWERVEPGDTVPAGECPKCNASADARRDQAGTQRHDRHHAGAGARHEVRRPLDRGRPLPTSCGLPPTGTAYPVEDLGSSGFRVAVYRETPKRDTVPRGYLRIEPA